MSDDVQIYRRFPSDGGVWRQLTCDCGGVIGFCNPDDADKLDSAMICRKCFLVAAQEDAND